MQGLYRGWSGLLSKQGCQGTEISKAGSCHCPRENETREGKVPTVSENHRRTRGAREEKTPTFGSFCFHLSPHLPLRSSSKIPEVRGAQGGLQGFSWAWEDRVVGRVPEAWRMVGAGGMAGADEGRPRLEPAREGRPKLLRWTDLFQCLREGPVVLAWAPVSRKNDFLHQGLIASPRNPERLCRATSLLPEGTISLRPSVPSPALPSSLFSKDEKDAVCLLCPPTFL